MKLLTKEEEQAHSSETWKGGIIGGLAGALGGAAAVFGASRRYHALRAIGLPLQAGLVTATTAFGGVINADRYSRAFERARHASEYEFQDRSVKESSAAEQQMSGGQKLKEWISEQRYPIVFGTWALGMVGSFAAVSRHPTLTGQQKLVQARVYAQVLTLAVLVASFGLEGNDMRSGKGRWETIRVVDPNDPEHKKMIDKKIHHESYAGEDQWMDMIESSEEKMKSKGHKVRAKGSKGNQGAQEESKDQEKSQDKGDNQKEESKERETAQDKGSSKKEESKGQEKSKEKSDSEKEAPAKG